MIEMLQVTLGLIVLVAGFILFKPGVFPIKLAYLCSMLFLSLAFLTGVDTQFAWLTQLGITSDWKWYGFTLLDVGVIFFVCGLGGMGLYESASFDTRRIYYKNERNTLLRIFRANKFFGIREWYSKYFKSKDESKKVAVLLNV